MALEQHGGVVEKFIGDAVVGLFGVEEAHEDDPVRAVRAALAAREAVARLNLEEPWLDLHIRIGVSTGEALVAVGASRTTSEGVVTGDVLNTTARIEAAAPTDGVLVGRRTYEAARASVELRARDPVEAKGKGEPVEVWEAVALVGAPATRTDAPFVGRGAELARLESLWREATSEGQARVVTLAAPAGTGKTRLVVELLDRIGAEFLRGRCLAYGEGITYWPLVEAFAGVVIEGDEAVERALVSLTGDEAITQGELHWGVRRALELRAAVRPSCWWWRTCTGQSRRCSSCFVRSRAPARRCSCWRRPAPTKRASYRARSSSCRRSPRTTHSSSCCDCSATTRRATCGRQWSVERVAIPSSSRRRRGRSGRRKASMRCRSRRVSMR